MNNLNGAVCYLSGAMEFVEDDGIGWRQEFTEKSYKANLNLSILDPTNKPKHISTTTSEDKNLQIKLQQEGKFKQLQLFVSDYRKKDLQLVNLSNFLVTMIHPSVPQWGTANEIYLAESQSKPNFIICPGGLSNLPRWLFDVVGKIHTDYLPDAMHQANVYDSIDSVIDELLKINSGEILMNDDWLIL